MAPRKKRVTKNAATTARTRSGIKYQAVEKDLRKLVGKKALEAKKNKDPPIIPPPEPVVTRSHKKFGKYRFFTENESLTQSERSSTDTTVSGEYGLKSIEEVLLPQSEVDMENEDEIVISEDEDSMNENSLGEESGVVNEEIETEMECAAAPRDSEAIISEKLSTLNVGSLQERHADSETTGSCDETECVTELGKEDAQSYQIESFESEVFIDCIAEETIPICGEQEIINETEDSNSIKEVICEGVEKTDKMEDLTSILEESRSENEELSQKDETAVTELAAILEDDNKDETIVKIEEVVVEDPKDVTLAEVEVIKEEEEEEIKDDPDEIKKESPKSKPKPKVSKKKSGKTDKNENPDKSENLVRRSNRIRSINVSRQKSSKGHGLVKQKSETLINENGDSNSSSAVEPQTSKTVQKNVGQISHPQDPQKHVKVKSRWRRSSELELNNSTLQNLNKIILPSPVPSETETNSSTANEETCHQRDHQEVAKRLKQFVHLKENLYLTERISCKEAKKMICDCFLTEEDIEEGEYGCGEDCLNRLLMIEW